MHDPFFLDLRSDPDPFVKSGSTIRSDPFTLLRKGSTIRYFQILFDPFRSDPYHVYLRIQFHKSCVFWNLTTFLTIARSHKIMILLRNANFSLKNAICLWKITGWENLFFIFKKIWLSFVQKDLEKKSDHFRSDPWFLDLRIRSRSSRRKWIYDPITILKNGDLDPKGSRSDHDRQISGFRSTKLWCKLTRIFSTLWSELKNRECKSSRVTLFFLIRLYFNDQSRPSLKMHSIGDRIER